MKMSEIVDQVSFMLGFPANDNIEGLQIEQAVLIAFRELKRYMRTPVDKTVPFSTRIDLKKNGIVTKCVTYVYTHKPRTGLAMSSLDAGNVFQVAAAVNTYSGMAEAGSANLDPIITQLAMSQVRNTLSTDLQWKFDVHNQVVYCTHREPRPTYVTIRYVPDYQDVSEIEIPMWQDYLVRLATANMKVALGRNRSKYRIEGSNVTLDGETLLTEGNAELEQVRQELQQHKQTFVVLN